MVRGQRTYILREQPQRYPSQHNRPLYVTAKVRDVELKRVLLDASSLNIISLDVLDDLGIPREKIQKHPFEVSSFNGSWSYTVGSISLDLTVGPIRTAHRFHVIALRRPITCYSGDLGSTDTRRSHKLTTNAWKQSGRERRCILTPQKYPFKEMKHISPRRSILMN